VDHNFVQEHVALLLVLSLLVTGLEELKALTERLDKLTVGKDCVLNPSNVLGGHCDTAIIAFHACYREFQGAV